MTVDAKPVAELPDPRDYGLAVVGEEELPAELTSLVAEVRSLVDAVAHTRAGDEELSAARASVAEAAARLRGGPRHEIGTMVRHIRDGGRVEYGTLTNLVAGPTNAAAPPLRLDTAPEGGLRAQVRLNGTYQGPPGLVHGGWLAALLDQALGAAAGAEGMPGLTAHLDVDYRRPTPLNTPLEITSRVTGTERRKVFVAAEIRHGGEVTAEGTAVMVRIDLPGEEGA
ncbi:PaaI family thioesterase [Streptomonospora wellingtoniae]|uniref:Acyl-coenzyme A thioesterase THEM4 n=1 Tax=Streptomonospora wellingtoniae TaxID=3075544 RepID=A0ABU2KPH9_9ACTN|nr:PaaI family thioesterase [Streptomonospora sp. DSM 45055]MDT0301173.1 PaaI family thioesterase [Streptomonospora sp. DSM 45055]